MRDIQYRYGILLFIALPACAGGTQRAATHVVPESSKVGGGPGADRLPKAAAIVPIPGAREPLPGVVTGGVPSDEDLKTAQAMGYRTIVSLLPATEGVDEAAHVEQLGMRFISIPVAGPADLTEANARRLGDALGDPQQRPMILHCGSGNRAGALLALEAFYVEHMSAQEAVKLGVRAGLASLRPAVEEHLGIAAQAPPQ